MKKRVACILLAALLLLPTTALAEYIHEFFRYTVEDGSVTITAYYGEESEVTVPAMIGGNPVNTIAKGAFSENRSVTVVNLPDTITTIEEGAFATWQEVRFSQTGATPAVTATPQTAAPQTAAPQPAQTTAAPTSGASESQRPQSTPTAASSGFEEADVTLEPAPVETGESDEPDSTEEPTAIPDEPESPRPIEAEITDAETPKPTAPQTTAAPQAEPAKKPEFLRSLIWALGGVAAAGVIAAVLYVLQRKKR